MHKKNYKIVFILIFITLALVLAILFVKTKSDEEIKNQTYSNVEESDSISIPGYDTINFVADSKKQDITLYNPESNTCYFKMSLKLNDGSVIWTSDLLEPGKKLKNIELDKTLKKGTYSESILKYECYSLKDKTQLNGAEIKVTIVVE